MQRFVFLQVFKQPSTNVVAICDAVKAIIPNLQEQLRLASAWPCAATAPRASVNR